MKTIIIITLFILNSTPAAAPQNINCEYLFFSGQGTEQERTICADEFVKINADTLEWKRAALEARGIY